MNSKAKSIVLYVILSGVAALLWVVVQSRPQPARATYSQFLQQVQSGQVTGATIVAAHTGANQVTYQLRDGSRGETVVPSDYRGVLEALQQKMVDIEIQDASRQWTRVLVNASPFLILLGVWVFMMRRLPRGRWIFGATPDAK
jgi:cell division protease FtsH